MKACSASRRALSTCASIWRFELSYSHAQPNATIVQPTRLIDVPSTNSESGSAADEIIPRTCNRVSVTTVATITVSHTRPLLAPTRSSAISGTSNSHAPFVVVDHAGDHGDHRDGEEDPDQRVAGPSEPTARAQHDQRRGEHEDLHDHREHRGTEAAHDRAECQEQQRQRDEREDEVRLQPTAARGVVVGRADVRSDECPLDPPLQSRP